MSSPLRRAAVLGHPIAHSLSPVLHLAAYEELGLDWIYSAHDVTAATLPNFVRSLGPEWVGLSLTMPLKESVLSLLTEVDSVAASVRSVNTVVLDGSTRKGYNTDVSGLGALLAGAKVGPSSSATILGSGATARSAVAAIAACGAGSVVVLARRPDAAAELVALAASYGLDAAPGDWPPTVEALGGDVVVSTVPAEVAGEVPVPERPALLVDVLYHPWPTPLAKAWAGAGGGVIGGMALLVAQAVEQVELMTGRRPTAELLMAVGSASLAERAGSEHFAQAEQ